MKEASKRDVIQKFLGHEDGLFKDWIVRAVEREEDEKIVLEAFRDDEAIGAPERLIHLEPESIHLQDGELDEATKTAIRDWLTSL